MQVGPVVLLVKGEGVLQLRAVFTIFPKAHLTPEIEKVIVAN